MTKPRPSDPQPWWLRYWLPLVSVGLILLLAYAVAAATVLPAWIVSRDGPFAIDPKVRVDDIASVRGQLLGLLGTVVLVIGAVVGFLNYRATTENDRRTYRLSQRGQVTDRFTKAIDQLGNVTDLAARIGGIYALEQIAFDSKEVHWPVMEVLTAFLRANSNSSPPTEKEEAEDEKASSYPAQKHDIKALEANVRSAKATAPPPTVAADLQAIATVLGRRHQLAEEGEHGRLDLSHVRLAEIYFANAHLVKANLFGAHLERADFHLADLESAIFTGAHLAGANLTGAHLTKASLAGAHLAKALLADAELDEASFNAAHLEGAFLFKAHLKRAVLFNAHLEGANLTSAVLEGADFTGAHLERANLEGSDLTRAQLDAALRDASTSLPAHLMDGQPPTGTI